MDIGSMISDLGEPIILAFLAPLLSPIIKFFDKGRYRAEFRNKMEDLILLAEFEDNISPADRLYSNDILHEKMKETVATSPYIAELTGINKNNYPNRFDMSDLFTSIAIPVAMMIISVLISEGFDDFFWSVFFALSAVLSILITRFLITPYYKNYLLKFMLEVATSLIAITCVTVLVRLYVSQLPP